MLEQLLSLQKLQQPSCGMHKMRELGILCFRVIIGKKWSCVNSVALISVNML